MTNKFYQLGAQRAEKVRDLFATVAPHYDLINDLQSLGLHRHWKRRLLRLAGLKPGDRVLDLCCGTGDLALGAMGLGAQVLGLDFSAPMLAVARSRSRNLYEGPRGPWSRGPAGHDGASRSRETLISADSAGSERRAATLPTPPPAQHASPVFLRGDARRTPFRDAQFDAIMIGYGLRNLDDLRAGLAEIHRLLRAGGRVVSLDFGKPPNALWRALYFYYLRWFVPGFGRVFCGDADAYAYIWESLKNYPGQEGVAAAMKELNFERVRVINILGGVMSINCGEKALSESLSIRGSAASFRPLD